jgi:hypothetical protein
MRALPFNACIAVRQCRVVRAGQLIFAPSFCSRCSCSQTSKIKLPNILITGTPGCGKTQTSELLVSELHKKLGLSFKHQQVGEIVKAKELHDGYDEEFDSYIHNDDKVAVVLRPSAV